MITARTDPMSQCTMPDLSVSRQEVLARQLNKVTPVNGLTPRSPLGFNHDNQKLTVANSLFQHIIKGNITKVRQLLSRGANIHVRNDYGFSPLVAALHVEQAGKRSKMFKLLLDRGANHKSRDEKHDRPVLHWACLLGQLMQVNTLLEESAGDINLQDTDAEGFTALHHAVRVGSLSIVDCLVHYHVRFGVSVDIPDKLGLTPFMHARRLGYKDLSAILREKGLASRGHGDHLFRCPREWSQIGKFERRKAIEIQTQNQINAAKIMGKLHMSINGSPRMAIPGIVVPSYRPPPPEERRRKAPHHISVSLPSLGEAASEETQDRPLSTSRVNDMNEKPGASGTAFTDSKSSIKSSATMRYSTHDINSSSAHTSTKSSFVHKRAPPPMTRINEPSYSSQSETSIPRQGLNPQPVGTNSNMAALSLLEQSSFSKGKMAKHFHHSQFDENKTAEYKHMFGNLNSIMEVLSQQQTKSFRKSVEVKKPETPPKPKKKNKVSTMAIIFGGRGKPKRGKSRSPGPSKRKGGKDDKKGKDKKVSSASSKENSISSTATSKKSTGNMNKLPVPTIRIS